jgi:hypothetical protein
MWKMMTERFAYAVRRPGWQPQHLSLQNPAVRAHLESVYQSSVDSGIQLLAVFTDGRNTSRHAYREQILDAFPNVTYGGQLRLELFRDCDHTFGSEHHRAQLTRLVMEWANDAKFESRAPSPAPGSASPSEQPTGDADRSRGHRDIKQSGSHAQ